MTTRPRKPLPTTKVCHDCRVEKPLDQFHPVNRSANRLRPRPYCVDCERARQRQAAKAHRDRRHAWDVANRDRRRAYHRDWQRAHPDRVRAYDQRQKRKQEDLDATHPTD